MQIRIMHMEDIPAGMRLRKVAGWNQTAEDWKRFLDASPEGCFVAEVDGRVCGTVTTIAYEGRFAWVGMVLVDPQHRGQGIGTQLLRKAIEFLDASHILTIKLDATPAGKPIYEKLGFIAEYEIERWVGTTPQATGETGSGASSVDWAHLDEVVAADRDVFGADRGGLLRSLNDDAPEFTAAIHEGGLLAGYTLGRRGSRADHLGPWTARTEAVARQLLENFLARSARDTRFVDCLKANPFAARLLHAAGFEFSRPLTRMVRGPNAFPGRSELFCAILGPEFG